MKIFGKDFLFNNKKVYHEGNKPIANDILFTDGQNFQQKLDNGSLRGPKGDKGDTGLQGPVGVAGPKGEDGKPGAIGPIGPAGAKGDIGPQGEKGTDGFTWRPSVNSSGDLTWTKDSSSTTPLAINIKGPKGEDGKPGLQGPKGDTGETGPRGEQGPKGADGLTTSITVNGQRYNHSGGNIILPNFLKEEGGTVSGTIKSTLDTGTYSDGNKGKAIINIEKVPGGFTTLARSISNNGVFALSAYYDNVLLSYTSNKTVSSGVNSLDKKLILLDEGGNSVFPGTIKAEKILGPNTIKLSRDSLYLGYLGYAQDCDNLRLGDTFIASDSNRDLHVINMNGTPVNVCANSFYSKDKWIKIGGRWLTIDVSAPSGAKGDIWIQCF